MQPVIDIIRRLQHDDPNVQYPEYNPNDGKIHVLYCSVPHNATGLYRCLLPTLALNTTKTHCAMVNDISPWLHQDRFRTYQLPFQDDVIKWAHYIVFPAVFSPHKEFKMIVDEFRCLNPGVKIFIDVDDDVLNISPYHPNIKSYTPELIKAFLINMKYADGVTCTHQRLCDWYAEKLPQQSNFFPIPNLMTKLTAPTGVAAPQMRIEKTHLGLTLNFTQLGDMIPVSRALKKLEKSKQYRITLFGWDAKLWHGGMMHNLMAKVRHQYVPAVPMQDYFLTLETLAYDIAVMPLRDNQFNRMKSNHKLLQYAQLGIPVVAPNMPPYNEALGPKRPALPFMEVNDPIDVREWQQKIQELTEDKNLRNKMVNEGRKIIDKHYLIESHGNVKIWQDTFA